MEESGARAGETDRSQHGEEENHSKRGCRIYSLGEQRCGGSAPLSCLRQYAEGTDYAGMEWS